jgi:hypothetical protein
MTSSVCPPYNTRKNFLLFLIKKKFERYSREPNYSNTKSLLGLLYGCDLRVWKHVTDTFTVQLDKKERKVQEIIRM